MNCSQNDRETEICEWTWTSVRIGIKRSDFVNWSIGMMSNIYLWDSIVPSCIEKWQSRLTVSDVLTLYLLYSNQKFSEWNHFIFHSFIKFDIFSLLCAVLCVRVRCQHFSRIRCTQDRLVRIRHTLCRRVHVSSTVQKYRVHSPCVFCIVCIVILLYMVILNVIDSQPNAIPA